MTTKLLLSMTSAGAHPYTSCSACIAYRTVGPCSFSAIESSCLFVV